jgi:colicin import membrane protein
LNTNAAQYRIPAEPGRWRAFALAMLMHLLLLGFLWVGVSWQNTVPVSIEAEIWSPQARMAAPPAPAPEPQPEPVKPAPPPPTPQVEPETKTSDADIALEKEKKRKQELDRKLAEEKKRLAEEQEKKKLAELDKKKQAEELRRKQEEIEQAQRDKARRDNNLSKLRALAGEGSANATGDAERASAPKTDPNYLGKIASIIKANLEFPTTAPGNPTIEYELELLPDGSVKEIKISCLSGNTAFDEAVKRAIYRSAPFPKDPATGKVPSSIPIRQRLKEN